MRDIFCELKRRHPPPTLPTREPWRRGRRRYIFHLLRVAANFRPFTGSSRKVVGFEPSERQSKVTDEGEEVLVIPVAIADTLGDLDLVVEAL